jgi:hypothetical protein
LEFFLRLPFPKVAALVVKLVDTQDLKWIKLNIWGIIKKGVALPL